MIAKTIKGKTTVEIQQALGQCSEHHFSPTLAIIFLTNIENAEPLRSLFNKEGITIFGISTSQKFTEQGLEEDDIVVLLLDILPDNFQIVLSDYDKACSVYDAARQVGEVGVQDFKNPGFIISSADFRMSGEELIKGLTDAAGKETVIMGGVAGDPADFSGIIFTNDASSTRGILALVIDQDKVAINGLAVSGWKPVGTTKKITKSEGPWIFTIDNEPALNVIQRFLGKEVAADYKMSGLIPSDLGYPLQFERASGSILMRPLLLFNPAEKSIMVGGDVNEGESFRFSLPPDFDAIDTVVNSTITVKEDTMPDADAMIVFSCIGRLGSFGPMISTEIEGLAATWKKPMIGIFSLGEFGKLDEHRCEFHGTTVSWVALKERN
ncbi:MAG TPA: FIST N-terminal domain-containing protein [Niabella sp.]|nr:FIST N-terminal domain-containing protein [Niabella sp.]HQW15472.1 FIST N-terminal domain-containing protein [Niabella sp.]HQX20614.1 FIST N-terminal domain-containing protein [Niabella sp.]HRB07018.1 FIST N-terminal domain-containing protein [Niabella sp.]HRB35824.1 FIST N-terminal domain-containing protein [Niabella sp.]